MKIGILTYHRSQNHGALLQAIALRYSLKKYGHEVYFVDYYPEYHKLMYDVLPNKSLLWMIKHPKSAIRQFRFCCNRYRRTKVNDVFLKKYIEPYCRSMNETYDVIVYGSDQIWRKQPGINVYNPVYFGLNDIKASAHVSYAASINSLPKSEEEKKYFCELLSNLDRISVREFALQSFVSNLGYKCELSLDPTLLMTETDWNTLFPPSKRTDKPYVLYYKVSDGIDEDEIENYAKQQGLDFKALYCSTQKKDYPNRLSVASPDTFIDLIRNAEIIITTSFHGMAFSINYRKPFFVHSNHGAMRIQSILDSLGISDRWIDGMEDIYTNTRSIKYDIVEQKLAHMKESSLLYLEQIKSLSLVL